jgi:hypothetical protein
MIVNGRSGFDGWLDSVRSIASALPSNTVVGRWGRGDNEGATAGLVREVQNLTAGSGGKTAPVQPYVVPPPTSMIPGVSDTMLLAGVGIVGLGAFFMLRQRKGGSRRRRRR